jgi:hypothetical protein
MSGLQQRKKRPETAAHIRPKSNAAPRWAIRGLMKGNFSKEMLFSKSSRDFQKTTFLGQYLRHSWLTIKPFGELLPE